MLQLSEPLHSLARRFSTSGTRTKLNVQFALIIAVILVQIAEIILLSGVEQVASEHRALWIALNIGTFLACLLLVASRLPILDDASRSGAIAEYIQDGLLFVERDTIVFANSLALNLIGNDPGSDPQGITIAEGSPLSDLSPEVQSILDQARTTPAPIPLETVIGDKKKYFFVSRIFDPGKTSIAATAQRQVYVFQDVTFLRENEDAKVNFIGTLSHEIKTPITSLTMALGMLDRIGYDSELVRIANADVARLRTLLEDLLNVSRLKIVRNPNALSKQETNLTALVQQTAKSVASFAAEKGARVNTFVQPQKHVTANIDPTKISWVLSTLLTDAIRQTPPGQDVAISLHTEAGQASITIQYERKFDSLGPAGYTIVRDIIEAHAGKFLSSHGPEHRSFFKLTLQAQVYSKETVQTAKPVIGKTVNLNQHHINRHTGAPANEANFTR